MGSFRVRDRVFYNCVSVIAASLLRRQGRDLSGSQVGGVRQYFLTKIFIYDAVKNVLAVFSYEAIDDHSALMSLVLRRRVREFLADFGSVIAIAVATAVAVFLHEEGLPPLVLPDTFTTTSGRPWLVDLFSGRRWADWRSCGSSRPAHWRCSASA